MNLWHASGSNAGGFFPSYTRPNGILACAILYWAGGALGILLGAAIVINLSFMQGIALLTTALMAVVGILTLVLGVIQLVLAFGLFALRRLAWVGAIVFSIIQLISSLIVMGSAVFLVARPLSLGGVSELLSDAGLALPLFGVIAWGLVFGLFSSFYCLAYLTRRHVRAIFGSLRLRESLGSRPTGQQLYYPASQPAYAPLPRLPSGQNPLNVPMRWPGYGANFPQGPLQQPSHPPFPTLPVNPAPIPQKAPTKQSSNFCTHCGAKVNSPYCPFCGSRVS